MFVCVENSCRSQMAEGFDQLPVKEFDYVITLGCQDACPFVPAKQHIDWNTADPKGKDVEFFRKVRDDVAEKIKELIRTCGAAGT